MVDNKKQGEEDKELSRFVLHNYKNRLLYVKEAQSYFARGDIHNAVKFYNKYLDALAAYCQTDADHLSPALFSKPEDFGEKMLLSLVYWDLAKLYDRNPKLIKELRHALSQFINFSAGNKFQFLNSENMRKYIRKKTCINLEIFEEAYRQIEVSSKKCYVATYCFGEQHPVTNNLRTFRPMLTRFALGRSFVRAYYENSPAFVSFCERHPRFGQPVAICLFRPVLYLFSMILEKFILKRSCSS